MHDKSQCHTLDRNNFDALADQCAKFDREVFQQAVEAQFEIDYYPYIHDKDSVTTCMKEISRYSWKNLQSNKAMVLLGQLTVGAAAILYS